MAESVNSQIADALVEQHLRDARVESHLRREVFAQLALLESEILSSIKSNDPTEWALLARRRLEVQRLMADEIDPLITERYQHIADLLDAALMRLARKEAGIVRETVNAVTHGQTIEEDPSTARLRAGVVRGIFPSAATATDFATFSADWWARQGQSLATRIGDSLTVGVSLEESLTTLTQRVRGTSELGFQDGILAKARQDASRLLTTQMTHAIGEARVAVAERNAAQLMLVHSSVLDSHTCFAATTLLRTPFGPCRISDFQDGHLVFGGSGQVRRVLATHITQTRQLARLTLADGTVLLCTPDHHFLTQDLQWVEAQQLQENTRLARATSLSDIPVVSVALIACEQPVAVYDITVDQDESFLLDNGVIAHNSTICIARHGLKYSAEPPHDPIGHSMPYLSGVPYHPSCRSSMLTVLRNGGPVTDESLNAWLRRRGPAFQDEVLGPTRARMWREGTLRSPRQLLDSATGRPLTLEELGV